MDWGSILGLAAAAAATAATGGAAGGALAATEAGAGAGAAGAGAAGAAGAAEAAGSLGSLAAQQGAALTGANATGVVGSQAPGMFSSLLNPAPMGGGVGLTAPQGGVLAAQAAPEVATMPGLSAGAQAAPGLSVGAPATGMQGTLANAGQLSPGAIAQVAKAGDVSRNLALAQKANAGLNMLDQPEPAPAGGMVPAPQRPGQQAPIQLASFGAMPMAGQVPLARPTMAQLLYGGNRG